jgi:hypothetical protein
MALVRSPVTTMDHVTVSMFTPARWSLLPRERHTGQVAVRVLLLSVTTGPFSLPSNGARQNAHF